MDPAGASCAPGSKPISMRSCWNALASWGPKRHEGYPDVPTFKELGYDIEYLIWAGLFAPRGTPEPVMKTLRDTARKAVEDAEFKGMMAKVNSPIHYLDAPEFQIDLQGHNAVSGSFRFEA